MVLPWWDLDPDHWRPEEDAQHVLDRHAVQALLRAGMKPRAVARQFRVSRRTIEQIAREAPVSMARDRILRRAGKDGTVAGVGRPRVTEAIRARLQALVLEDAERPAGELARLLTEEDTPLGLSTVYRVLRAVRATIPVSSWCASKAWRANSPSLISAR